ERWPREDRVAPELVGGVERAEQQRGEREPGERPEPRGDGRAGHEARALGEREPGQQRQTHEPGGAETRGRAPVAGDGKPPLREPERPSVEHDSGRKRDVEADAGPQRGVGPAGPHSGLRGAPAEQEGEPAEQDHGERGRRHVGRAEDAEQEWWSGDVRWKRMRTLAVEVRGEPAHGEEPGRDGDEREEGKAEEPDESPAARPGVAPGQAPDREHAERREDRWRDVQWIDE